MQHAERTPNNNKQPIVYVVDPSLAVTGAFVCATRIAGALDEMAHVVLVLPLDSAIDPERSDDFAEVRHLPLRPLRRSMRAALGYLPGVLRDGIALRKLMARDGASILILNDFYLMQGAVMRLLGFRGQILSWVRIDPAAFGAVSRVWLWIMYSSADTVVAVSEFIRGKIRDPVRTKLLYDSVAPELLGPLDKASHNAPFCFVFIGNYIKGKGQDLALAAFAQAVQAMPEMRLEFYGGDMGLEKNRNYRRALEQTARKLAIDQMVHFGDFITDPAAVLRGKLAALNMSHSESFSMTVLEASALGLPVIATRSGGPQEIIVHQKTGLLIDTDDVTACAQAMLRLAQDPPAAAAMGAAGRERVLAKFSPQVFKTKLLSLLNIDDKRGE